MLETIGRYKLLDPMGTGGIGEAFRARDTRLGRTVALKVASTEIAGDEGRRAQFVSDAKAASALSHPNIATLYEVADDQGVLFLAVEFVPGEPLSRVISGGGLNPRRAIDYAIQIADALAEAHAVGITHRDLTPTNIVITPKGTVKILEFGLASWTRGGRLRGEHDDIYSLGAVMFAMITGKPFDTRSSAVVRPISVGREVPHELDPIVARMLTKDGNGYESPATVAAELRALAEALDLRNKTVPVSPPDPPRHQRRPDRRWLIVVLAMVVVAAIAWIAFLR